MSDSPQQPSFAEQYQKWLNDPMTRSVFAMAEQVARPAAMEEVNTEANASYQLGFVSGAWWIMDFMRDIQTQENESPEPTYLSSSEQEE